MIVNSLYRHFPIALSTRNFIIIVNIQSYLLLVDYACPLMAETYLEPPQTPARRRRQVPSQRANTITVAVSPTKRESEFSVFILLLCTLSDAMLITESTLLNYQDADDDSGTHFRLPICDMKVGDARHLELDFRLVDANGFTRNPTSDESQVLFNLFPETVGAGVCGPFLWVTVRKMPSHPWPVSVAGLPLYVSTLDFEIPWRTGGPGNPHFSVLESLDSRSTINEELYYAVVDFFDSRSIEIYQVTWTLGGWQIEVNANVDKGLLPARICQSLVGYLIHDPETGIEAALRLEQPISNEPDDSVCEFLRPGVMVASSRTASTAGMLVQDKNGKKYITVSALAFPPDDSSIQRPLPQSPSIGSVVSRIRTTDIALAVIDENTVFQNGTFSGVRSEKTFLKGIRNPTDVKPFEHLFMENSFTGNTDAIFIHARLQRFPSTNPNIYTWIWQD